MAESINVAAVTPQISQSIANSKTPDVNKAVSAPESSKPAEKTEISVEELQAAIDKLNDFMRQGQRSLSFSVDQSADEVIVKVVDTQTQELVRQIPNEETLRIKEHLESMLGLLFNDKA